MKRESDEPRAWVASPFSRERGRVRVCLENWGFGFELLTSIRSPCPRREAKIADPVQLRLARFPIQLRRHGPPSETLVRGRVPGQCHRDITKSSICRG